MSFEDQVMALLEEGNPATELGDDDWSPIDVATYLATLETRSSAVTQITTKQAKRDTKSNPTRMSKIAAVIVMVAGTTLLIATWLGGGSPVANGGDLRGTWDHELDPAQAQLILDNYRIDSAEEVVIRLGFDGSAFWEGVLFDGELYLVDGVPEGEAGTFTIQDDLLITTAPDGIFKVIYRLELDGDELTLTLVERCPLVNLCMEDRALIEERDPLLMVVWEHTFVKSGSDPSY